MAFSKTVDGQREIHQYKCGKCSRWSFGDLDVLDGWCVGCKTWNGGEGAKNPIWIMWDGEMKRVSAMETSHILFCIGMIMHRQNWRQRFMAPLLQELKNRKERGDDISEADPQW